MTNTKHPKSIQISGGLFVSFHSTGIHICFDDNQLF